LQTAEKHKLGQPLSASLADFYREMVAQEGWQLGTTMVVYVTDNQTVGIKPML